MNWSETKGQIKDDAITGDSTIRDVSIDGNTILIIAYGNRLRRDDGAGLVFARRIASVWREKGIRLRLLERQQLTPELAWEMAQPAISAVLFMDTRQVQQSHKVSDLLIQKVRLDPVSPSLGHQLDPAALCLYAQHLYDQKPPAWLLTLPGWDFGHGEGVSARAAEAIENAFQLVSNQHLDCLSIGVLSSPL